MSYDIMFESVKSTSSRSKNFEQLDAQQKQDVLDFVEYLKSNSDFSTNSINSYKSYITKAMLDSKNLTNDQKSAVRKFQEFMSKKASAVVSLLGQ